MKKRILMIDDEPDMLKMTKYSLEHSGYEVFTATEGEEGIKNLDQIKPDLVILDLKLPGKSGFQIAKAIKALQGYKDIPIIVLSGMTNGASKYIAAKSGVLEYIEKPVDFEKLKFHIKDLLNK